MPSFPRTELEAARARLAFAKQLLPQVQVRPAARASLTEVRVRERAYFVLVDKIWSRPSGGGDDDESRRVDIVVDSCS